MKASVAGDEEQEGNGMKRARRRGRGQYRQVWWVGKGLDFLPCAKEGHDSSHCYDLVCTMF